MLNLLLSFEALYMKDFFSFLSGSASISPSTAIRSKIKLIVIILPIMFFVVVFTLLLQILLIKLEITQPVQSSGMIPDYMRSMSRFRVILEMVFLAPFLEETAFRGLLQKKTGWFRISLMSIVYLLICRVFGINFYEVSLSTILALICGLLTLSIPTKNIDSAIIFLQIRSRRIILIWAGAFLFALWHYYNFDFSGTGLLTIAVTLLPFMINGLLFAYIATKNGLQWSIFLHMANNLWPMIIWL